MAISSRRYRLEHCTVYHYSEPVLLSHQQLHLTPRPLATQRILTHAVTIQPAPTLSHETIDAFGNPLTEIAMESAHRTLDIAAHTTLDLVAPAAVEKTPDSAWEIVRDALRYRAGWRPDPSTLEATQFLFESPRVRVKRALRAYADRKSVV